MELVWDETFKQLNVDTKNGTIVATWPDCENREKMLELYFERFGFEKVYVQNSTASAVYSYGRTTGLVVDVGHVGTRLSASFEGVFIPQLRRRTSVGGLMMDAYMRRALTQLGLKEDQARDSEVVHNIKHKFSNVAKN